MHRIAIGGDDDAGRRALEALGLSVRAAKPGSESWRFETCRADYGEVMRIASDIRTALGGRLVLKANLAGQSLPYTRAADVRPGMLMVVDGGEVDVVASVERLPRATRTVVDLDVSPTHNYVANGVVTHNSIYAFRGANVGNMEDFRRDFRVENIVRLEQNYRSHAHILNAANGLIGHNRKRLGKNLWTSAGEGELLRVYEAQSDGYEANFVVEEIAALVREGFARRDVAVLYRSNAQSRILEHALFSQGIPYRVYGGLRFFERQEIKHALAYLRLIASPDDDGAFLRVVNFPTRGIGARSVEAVQDGARAYGSTLWHAATHLTGKSAASVSAFVRLVQEMQAATAGLTLAETVEHVIEKSGLVAHYRKEKDGAERVENLEELVNAAAAFTADDAGAALSAATVAAAATVGDGEPAPTDPLAAFLAHAALESGDNQAGEGADAVQLMTVHSAKGLEFHAVFITGLEEGLFPHESSVTEDDGLEEERRLMYVAITRARTRLYLTFSQTRMLHGQTRYAVASRFLDELPKETLRWITPRLAHDVRPGRLDDRAWSAAEPPPRYAARGADKGGLPFRIGQNVVHPKFGQGVIVSAEGSGPEARVQINFGRQGMKWLQLEYAKLTAA